MLSRAVGVESLAYEALGRQIRLNVARPHVLCAVAAAALRTSRKMEKIRVQHLERQRMGEAGWRAGTIPCEWDSIPPLAESLRKWLDRYLEDIQDLSESTDTLSAAQPPSRLLG